MAASRLAGSNPALSASTQKKPSARSLAEGFFLVRDFAFLSQNVVKLCFVLSFCLARLLFAKFIVRAAEGATFLDFAHNAAVPRLRPCAPQNAKRTDDANCCKHSFQCHFVDSSQVDKAFSSQSPGATKRQNQSLVCESFLAPVSAKAGSRYSSRATRAGLIERDARDWLVGCLI